MEKYRAIPQGYMTVGEVAKKMDVTVRTLQHYDKAGLLSPSAMSDGGRRLYTDKDVVKLHQILSLKHLGFSLDDIRDRLIPLDAPADVAQILSEQAATIRKKIADMTESLSAIEALRTEVLEMQSVDFKKYADRVIMRFCGKAAALISQNRRLDILCRQYGEPLTHALLSVDRYRVSITATCARVASPLGPTCPFP